MPNDALTPARLDALTALYAAATSGEWEWEPRGRDWYLGGESDILLADQSSYGTPTLDSADRAAIVALHNSFPSMADALRQAWAERDTALFGYEQEHTMHLRNVAFWGEMLNTQDATIRELQAERDLARTQRDDAVLARQADLATWEDARNLEAERDMARDRMHEMRDQRDALQAELHQLREAHG